MTEDLILEEQTGAILTLTLNDPSTLNSLTSEILTRLAGCLREADNDSSIRVVVLTGAGGAFCAGQNLAERTDLAALDVTEHLKQYYEPVLRTMHEMEKPIVASVNGVAAGAGLSLALAADFRVAAQRATFVQAFVRIGLVPDAGSTYHLPRLIGWGRAMELMMLGDTIDANTALRYGMINRIVDDQELSTATIELASRLARGPRSMGLVKRLLNASGHSSFDEQLAHEASAQAAALASADFVRGVSAFLAKEPAHFQGD